MRHVLTKEDRRKGFRNALAKIRAKIANEGDTDNNYAYLAWLMRRVRGVGVDKSG